MADSLTLPPSAKVYEVEPGKRYIIYLGDVSKAAAEVVAAEAGKLFPGQTIVCHGMVDLRLIEIERGAKYLLKFHDDTDYAKHLPQVIKVLRQFGVEAMGLPDGSGALFKIDDGGAKDEEEADGQ